MKNIMISLAMAVAVLSVMWSLALAKSVTVDLVSDVFRVPAYQTRWHRVYLSEGSLVDIEITGNGETDLDLYVYDGSDRYITGSENASDDELAELEILRGGYFYIAVVNKGNAANEYELIVDEY